MKILRLETKLFVIGISAILLFVGVNALTVNWGVDPTTGQAYAGYDTAMITNSNGKAWTATGANLQAAIYDLNGTYNGVVYLPDATITCTDTIYYTSYLTIQGAGLSNSILSFPAKSGFAMEPAAHTEVLRHVKFNDFHVYGQGSSDYGIFIEDAYDFFWTSVKVSYFTKTGIVLNDGVNGTGGCVFDNVHSYGNAEGVRYNGTGTASWISFNIWRSCRFVANTETAFNMSGVAGDSWNNNAFYSCQFEVCDVGLRCGELGTQNQILVIQGYFDTCATWDIWAGDGATSMQIIGGLIHAARMHSTKGFDVRANKPTSLTIVPTGSKQMGDFYCDGTDDDIQINYAIDLGAETITLLAGTFTVSANIFGAAHSLPNRVLQGVGWNTIITTATDNLDIILLHPGADYTTIRNLKIRGFTTGTGSDTLLYLNGPERCIFENIWIETTIEEGVLAYRTYNSTFRDIYVTGLRGGIVGREADDCLFIGCRCWDLTGNGISLDECYRATITNGFFHDCADGIEVNTDQNVRNNCSFNIIANNVCYGNSANGISIKHNDCFMNVVTSNSLTANTANLGDSGTGTISDNNIEYG